MIRAVSVAALAAVLSAQTGAFDMYVENKTVDSKGAAAEARETAEVKEATPIAGAILVQKETLKEAKIRANILISEVKTTVSESADTSIVSNSAIETGTKDEAADRFVALPVNASEDMQRMIYDAANEYGLDYTLVLALIQKESDFQADLISSSGDYGLMQINKTIHKRLREELGITEFLDPKQNVKAGCYLLNGYMQKYKYENLALMAYNCGEGGARVLWDDGVWSTKYSRKIMKIQKEITK